MEKNISKEHLSVFEQIRKVDERNVEFWSARDMAKVLEYTDFRNFRNVIDKAKEACENSRQKVSDHFVDTNEMVIIGSGAERLFPSVKLSRYACYLIVQNADPSKEVVANEQTYFAVQSRSYGTLLTVSFNLRNRKHDTLPQMLYRPCGTAQSCVLRRWNVRRLKSAVNKVSSLRDLFGWVA